GDLVDHHSASSIAGCVRGSGVSNLSLEEGLEVHTLDLTEGRLPRDPEIQVQVEATPPDEPTPVVTGGIAHELVDGLQDRRLVRISEVEFVAGPVGEQDIPVQDDVRARAR